MIHLHLHSVASFLDGADFIENLVARADFLLPPPDPGADVNCDGWVNTLDLNVVLKNFGMVGEPQRVRMTGGANRGAPAGVESPSLRRSDTLHVERTPIRDFQGVLLVPTVRVRDRRIYVDDTPIPLISGEVHYWRLAPARWRAILERVREMGLDTIATYVCWEYHELEPGRYDFTGATEPQRDLVGFLDLVREMGFWLFIRPGPYIYSEWQNAGVPDRVATYHRLSPEYQAEARPWMEAVAAVIKPYLATHGGPIVAFQPDNEMDLFTHWFEDELGLRGGDGLFQRFLRQRYGTIEGLNNAWQCSYVDFAEARAYAELPPGATAGERARVLDYWRFQHWSVAECVRWHVEVYRECGIDVPIYHNYYYGGDVQNWRELSAHCDFLGIDVYPGNEFEQTGYPGDQRLCLDVCRCQRNVSPIPYIAEFEAGAWHGLHEMAGVMSPNHYRLICFTALAAGIAGWNWYMLVNRDNWYYCPIQEWGRIRPEMYSVFHDIVRVYGELDPPSLQKLTDTSVVIDPLQIAADRSLRKNAILDALYAADLDYETLDLVTGETPKPLIIYAGSEWLGKREQEKLAELVDQGATLVVFKSAPVLDDSLQPLNLLDVAKPIGILSALGKRVVLNLGNERPVVEGALFEYERAGTYREWIEAEQTLGELQAVENSDLLALRYQGKRFTVGYVEPRGRGKLVVLGIEPNADVMRALHRRFGVRTYATTDATGVITALFQRGDEHYLVATNNANEEQTFRVRLDVLGITGAYRVTDLWAGCTDTFAGDPVLHLERKSGSAWRIHAG
ncbi:MAG: beta-galactosidase [Fimbriimonadia bacterium]|jgi:hypothetical protein